MRHLCKVSQRGHETGMTSKNLSIVWAPNLLRSRADDGYSKVGGCTNLKDIGLQVMGILVTNFQFSGVGSLFMGGGQGGGYKNNIVGLRYLYDLKLQLESNLYQLV